MPMFPRRIELELHEMDAAGADRFALEVAELIEHTYPNSVRAVVSEPVVMGHEFLAMKHAPERNGNGDRDSHDGCDVCEALTVIRQVQFFE